MAGTSTLRAAVSVWFATIAFIAAVGKPKRPEAVVDSLRADRAVGGTRVQDARCRESDMTTVRADAAPGAEARVLRIAGDVFADRWPMLSRAMGQYRQNVAAEYTQAVYDCVQAGIVRLDDRERLEALAADLGIKPFDAQLLMACAIRQWSLDRRYDPRPTRNAPKLSREYKMYSTSMLRWGVVIGFAVALDALIIWRLF